MLGGIDPIIIFQFSKLAPTLGAVISKIPLVSKDSLLVTMPPIPIYLSENLTGVFIQNEDKSVDIETDIETKTDGSEADVSQKGLASTVAVNLTAKKNSLGLTLLSAMIDTIFDKATSKEYSITYLHGATTIFRGLIQSYSVSQNANDELLQIKVEITKGKKSPVKLPDIPAVGAVRGAVPL